MPGIRKKALMKSPLENKWVLITGASSGFGAAAARAFGVKGAKLLLGARRVDRLKITAAEALKAGAAAVHFINWMYQELRALKHSLRGRGRKLEAGSQKPEVCTS
jgi:NADP-dependent 3-hydroxy acid dehydrogenase YdfG